MWCWHQLHLRLLQFRVQMGTGGSATHRANGAAGDELGVLAWVWPPIHTRHILLLFLCVGWIVRPLVPGGTSSVLPCRACGWCSTCAPTRYHGVCSTCQNILLATITTPAPHRGWPRSIPLFRFVIGGARGCLRANCHNDSTLGRIPKWIALLVLRVLGPLLGRNKDRPRRETGAEPSPLRERRRASTSERRAAPSETFSARAGRSGSVPSRQAMAQALRQHAGLRLRPSVGAQ